MSDGQAGVRGFWRVAGALLLGLALVPFLAWVGGIRASAATGVRYVAPGGNCGGMTPCYGSIQAAVDAAADGDVIKVAEGTYSGSQTRLSKTTGYTYTQVVLVDGKALTLEGGYTTANWNTADPLSHPTIIDAQQYGRGMTIVGNGGITVTVRGFQIVNGDYTNLGNPAGVGNAACPSTSGDCAGGLLAYKVTLILQDSLVQQNTASRLRPYSNAGGVLLWQTGDGTLIENTRIFSNTNIVEGYGGGLVAHYTRGGLTIRNSQFDQNHSTFDGGGLLLQSVEGPVLIENSRFVGNSAVGRMDAQGGAIEALASSNMTLDRVEFRDNRAYENGAALHVRQIGLANITVRLVNVLAAGNQLQGASTYGAAINLVGTGGNFTVQALHTTVAANSTPAGVRVAQYPFEGPTVSAWFTNTLFSDGTYGLVGVHYTGTLAITQTHSLFFNVANPTAAEAGTPIFHTTGTVTGDPKLDANQRLQAGSAAIDAGVNSGVTLDLDGGVRPAGSGYDIGADEFSSAAPGTFRFHQATYATPEGQAVTLTVERVNGSAGAVSVQYVTSDGTATAGNDYTAASGTLSFADGETSKTFQIVTTQDTAVEADETLVVTLRNPTGGATLGTPHQAVVTIQDDDVAPAGQLRFAQSAFTVLENAGTAVITVQRVNGSSGTVTVDYATSQGTATPGSDYLDTSGTLTFADGETSKSFTVTILDDTIDDPDETIQVALTNATGGATLIAPSQAVITIVQSGYRLYLPLIVR